MLFTDAAGYSRHSSRQREQAAWLMNLLDLRAGDRVLDVGCGDGQVTRDLFAHFPGISVHGIDISPEMVSFARGQGAGPTFEVGGVCDYEPAVPYDAVFSNSAMHWVLPPEVGYRKLFAALVPGGQLAVHQGGSGTYRELRDCAVAAVSALGLTLLLVDWTYPVYYPTAGELEDLLAEVGFVEVLVTAIESHVPASLTLARAFGHAGLLPYTNLVPPAGREAFEAEFERRVERLPTDVYEHRLLAAARRPLTMTDRDRTAVPTSAGR